MPNLFCSLWNAARPGAVAGIALVPLFFFVAPRPAQAASAISCHCFQDRTYNPADPQRVDPYLLANARNSLLAAAFGLDKKTIVRARMGGATGEDLWIANYLSWRSGIGADELARRRQPYPSWTVALTTGRIIAADPGALFGAALKRGAGDPELAAAAADEVLAGPAKVPLPELRQLRLNGAETGEIILAQVISRRSDRSAIKVMADVRGGRAAWGGLLESVGLRPAYLEGAVRALLPTAHE